MTVEEAIRILDPHTSEAVIKKLMAERGLSQEEIVHEIEGACELACRALGRCQGEGEL